MALTTVRSAQLLDNSIVNADIASSAAIASSKLNLTAITNFGLRSTGSGAFDLTLANTEDLTAGKTLTIKVNDAARTIDLGGNLTLANAFITSGNFSLTLVVTALTSLTLPTTGTLATLLGIETLTNKTLTATSNTVTAKALFSATTTVDVFAATAPTSGQVLTATGASAATWQTPSSPVAPNVVALTDGANIATDASLGNEFTVTLAGNRTLDNPTNPTNGQKNIWRFKQDATGGRTITLGSAFRLGTDITAVTLTADANAIDYMTAVYSSVDTKWDVVGFIRGYGV